MGVGRVTGLLVRERAELGYGLLSLDIRLVIPYGWMTGRNTVTGLFDWEDRQASMARKPVCSSPADGGSSIWLVCFAFFLLLAAVEISAGFTAGQREKEREKGDRVSFYVQKFHVCDGVVVFLRREICLKLMERRTM